MFRSLLPRHYFAGIFLILLLAALGFYFLYERDYRQSFSKTFDNAFTAATQPQTFLKLPADLEVELGEFQGLRKLAYSTWIQKKDGSRYLFRIVLPPSDKCFWGINLEVLPSKDPHGAQYPAQFKSYELVAPTVVPTPERWGSEKVVKSGVKIEMKVVTAKFIMDPWFDGPPYAYENLQLHLHLGENQVSGRPPSLPYNHLKRDSFLKSAQVTSPLDKSLLLVLFVLMMTLGGNPIFLILFLAIFAFFFFAIVRWLRAIRCPECHRPISQGKPFCGICGYRRKIDPTFMGHNHSGG